MSESVETRRAHPLPLLRAARAVFDLSLEGMLISRRSAFMAALLGIPVALAILYRVLSSGDATPPLSGFDAYSFILTVFYVRNAVPFAALFYASALVGDEVEGRTITFLLTRPIPRAAILLGKFAAYLATGIALSLPAIVVTFLLLVSAQGLDRVGPLVGDLARDLGVVALALLAYGALFTLLGVVLRRPLIPGLMFLLLWEMLANLPGYLPRFTVTAYLRSLIPYRPPLEGLSEVFGQVLPTGLSLTVLSGIAVVGLAAAVGIFSIREYVPEQ